MTPFTRQGDTYNTSSFWLCSLHLFHCWAVPDVVSFLFAILRSKWAGKVYAGEHPLQIPSEPQIFRLEPGREDPQDSGDQSYWTR